MDVGPPNLPPRRRRARAIADAPVDDLLVHCEELAKGWLLTLLEEVPLAQAPSILAAEVAQDGPRLCAAVLRAIVSDTDLRRLAPGGALEMLAAKTGRLAGAADPEEASRAADALGGVLWSALRDSLSQPEPDEVARLLERLGVVMEHVRGAALRGSAIQPAPQPVEAQPQPVEPEPAHPYEHFSPERQPPVHEPSQAEATLRVAPPSPTQSEGTSAETSPEPLWVGAVKDEITRANQAAASLSLLLVELEEADRMVVLERESGVAGTFGRFAQAVRSVLRRQDILACESDTRAWIIAPETGRLGAQALGARVVAAVRSAPPWRGAPLAVSVGLAVLEEDGRDHESLIEAAEESRFAAEARGVGIEGERGSAAPDFDPRD